VYAAFFPVGFVFSMSYPEALILLLLAAAGAAAAHGRWKTVAVLAAAAALGRPEAAFLVLPLGVLVARAWRTLDPRRRAEAVAAVAAAPAALLALLAYDARALRDASAFSVSQVAWGRKLSPLGFDHAWHELVRLHDPWLFRDLAFLVVYLVCLLLARRAHVPLGWIVAGSLTVLLPIESGSLTSIARFGLLAPAVYCGLAYAGRRPAADLALRYSSLGLLALGAATIPAHFP
jgi:hypothetical protein